MWNKLTGKSDTSSQDGRRKDQRRRTGSVASSHASRNPTRLEDRSDYPPTLSSRGTTYLPPPSSASIASYATAPDRRSTMDHDVRSERTAAYDDREDDPRSERSSKHRERSTSRDRKRDRDDTERGHKKKGKKDTKDGKERREKDESSKKSTHKSRARASSKASDSIVDEPVRPRAGDSLRRGDSYTSQTAYQAFKYATDSAPATPSERLDAHVGGQFPGQNPSQYAGAYRPPLGEATSYYGDQGESVTYQPGVRVEDPDMLINPHTHLITPSAVPQPPEETGHGSAADFYSGTFDVGVGEDPPTKPPRPQSMPGSFEPDARPKPTRKSSKTEKVHKLSSTASAAGSAALGYALGKHSSHNQSESTHVSSRIEENVENYTSSSGKNSGHYSTSYSVPPSGDYVPPTSQSGRPGGNYISGNDSGHRPTSYSMPPSGEYVPVTSQASRPGLMQSYSMPASGAYVPVASQSSKPGKSFSHSNAGLYAGAAGLAAGYGLHELHSSHHHSPALPPRPGQNGNHGSQGLGHAALGMQHRQTGPVSKFVDWWKDHEDVRKMEEYTEYIGVCRDCFDPREPPSMAPRKHHYHHHHKRRSNGSLRSNRVDKESRYHYSSSDDDGRRNSNSWVAKGLAGYGLAKVGKALWWQNQDFDDTYSAKSGRRYRSSRSSTGRRSRSGSRDRTSTTSRGVVRHRSNSRDSDTSRNYSKTTRDYKVVHHHGHSRSRSRSRDRKSGVFSAASGAALGASLVGRSTERSRSRSKSPSREYVIEKSYVEKPRSSGSALGVEDARRFRSRHSTTSSHTDHKSHRSSNQNLTGVFGLFTSATSASNRRKTHSKKKKGFFTFANGSSSSTDSGLVYGGSPELRRRSSELRRKGSHKKRRNSDDKLNSTLLGLGATAAALAAVQGRRDEKARSKHRPSPEVIAVRESKSRKHSDKRQHMPGSYDISSSEDEEWEEVSDAEDDVASIDTGLAFGDYSQSIKSRKSVDSLRSDGSGTNKWDWRWGSKKDKRKRTSTESLKNGTHVDGRSSVSSVPTLQTVFPVPTSDPTMFDAAGRSSSIPSTPQAPYGRPLVSSRPEPPPLQQPQPIMPVSNSIYTSQALGPSYMEPSGPPVFSNSRPPLANSRHSSDYFRAEDRPMGSPRREEPSIPTSSWKRDATIAGIAAATGAAIATAHSHASSKAGSSSPSQSTASRRVSSPSSVRFDLTKEQEAREDRQRRKDLRRKEEERAERERLRRLEDEASLKEAKKREEAESLAAIKRDAEELQARAREKRDREGRAYAASEMERETRRIQRERETMALQAAELERTARDEAERLRQESEAATRQRERLEREILEADSRRERERAEAEERQPSEFEYDVESREQQLQQREADVVDPDKWSGWKEPAAAAAAVGIAAGAAAAAGLAYSSENDQQEAPRDDSSRGGKVQFDDDRIYEEPSFDPDYFRKKDQARPSSRDRESDIVRKAASKVLADYDDDSAKVLADLEERYKEPQRRQSMAEFFSPSELSDRKTSISRDYFGPNADANVQSFNVPRIVTVEPPYAPEYSFTATHDDEDAHRYNDIPRLNLIEPTPPVSVASSIRGDRSHPTSPSMPAHHEPITTVEEEVEPKDDKQPKRPGVTWGVDETHYFDTPTPDSFREHFVSDQDLRKSALEELTRRKEHEQQDRQRERQEYDEIVVEHDSPSSPGKRTSYRMSPERSYAEAELPPKPELDRKPKSRSSDDDSPVEEIKRFEDDDREIIEATSPERTPVVLTPTEQRGQFYQSPFFETVSDFTTAFDVSPTGSASGIVEELGPDERPDVSERGMPGAWGFVEEDVASNPFSDTRVVEELPSPTEPHRKDPDLQPKVEEVEDQVFEKPLSKREQRKKDKAAKGGSLGHDDSPSVASTPMDEPVPEELWEDTSSSKSKKKKKKNRDSFGIDTGTASAPVASTPVAEEPAAEDLWAEVPLSKKDKRKKKEREREEKRMERERDPKDMEPLINTTSGSYTPSASGLDIAGDVAKGLGYAAAAGVLADAMTGPKHKEKQPEEPRGREQIPRQPPYPTEDPYIGFSQTPGSYGSEGEHTPSGTFTSTAPYIPSRAFDDVEELADAKKPGKKGKRRSKYGSPSPGSPLRTEVAFDDYVGMDAAAAATAALPNGSNAGAYQTSDFADAVNAPLPKDDASVSSHESEKESRHRRQYVYDEPEEAGVPLFVYREQEADNERNSVFAYRDNWKEHRRGSRQESEGGVSREGGDARSTASDERVVDEQGRRKHRHHRRRESERSDSTRDADTRSVVSDSRYDEEGHRKHKHRKHRSTGVDRDDVGAVVAEFRDDEDDDLRRKHKHKKRFEIEPTIPERPKSDPGVEDAGEERRKHKRRSKRESERGDDEDNASVVSGPAKYSEKEKEKRSSLFSSLFGRSSKESVASRESKDDRSIDDEERKHRRRKHRSSTLQSSHASDPEDDGVSSTTASRRHRSSSSSRREKESARDDSGMDYNSSQQRKHEHDKVFDYYPSSRVTASLFSASTTVGDESRSFPPAAVLAGGSPFPTTIEDDDGVGHVYNERRQSFLSRSSSPLSYVDDAVEDILSTGSKQIYTSTPSTATTAAATSADLSNPPPSQQSPHVASQKEEKSFLSRRARGPEAPASLTSPPLPINTSVEHAVQQSPLPSASHQHPPTTAASLLSLGGSENDPEFDEVYPIFTALPPSRPGSPTDVVPAAADESTITSPPPSLGINTKALKQVESPAQGMRSPSATAIPLRFRIGASRNVSGRTSAVQSPVEPHHGSSATGGAWDEQPQHQNLDFSPSPSPFQDRYYAQAPWQQQHQEFAASSPVPTTMPTPKHSRHATASPMPSPTAIPNPFFRPRPSSMHMHKKTSSAGVVSTGKEFRPLYLVESVRGRSKSSPSGVRGKERWTADEQAWAEARGDRWDDVAVEDLPALPGSRRGSEASVQSARSADDEPEGDAARKDVDDAVQPEMVEISRDSPVHSLAETTPAPTSTNVFDFLVEDDDDDEPTGTASKQDPSIEQTPKTPASKKSSPASSLFGGLLSRTSSKKGKKGKKAKKLGTASPPRSSSPPPRDPELDLAWRERDTADAVADWFEGGDDPLAGESAADATKEPGEPIAKKEEEVPKELHVPPALLTRDSKGKAKGKAKGKSKAKSKKGKDKGKSEGQNDDDVQQEAGDQGLSEAPTPGAATPLEAQDPSHLASGFDRDVDRDLWREELELHRSGNERSRSRSPRAPLEPLGVFEGHQMSASQGLGENPLIETEQESVAPRDQPIVQPLAQDSPPVQAPVDVFAYLEREDEPNIPSTSSSAPVPESVSVRAPIDVGPDSTSSTREQHKSPDVRDKHQDNAAAVGSGLAAATGALLATHGQEERQTPALPEAEPVVEEPSMPESSAPADDSDLNPVLAPAKVSKKGKRKAKKKNKLLRGQSDDGVTTVRAPSPTPAAAKGLEEETVGPLLSESGSAPAVGDESSLPKTTGGDEGEGVGGPAATPVLRDEGTTGRSEVELRGVSDELDAAQPQSLEPDLRQETGPSFKEPQEERPVGGDFDQAATPLEQPSDFHPISHAERQPSPELEHDLPRHEFSVVAQSTSAEQQHETPDNEAFFTPLPVSPPSSPPSLPITSAVMESIFSATEQAGYPRGLAGWDYRQELGRDNVANMPLPDLAEDEMHVHREEPLMESEQSRGLETEEGNDVKTAPASDHTQQEDQASNSQGEAETTSTVKPQKIPIPPNYLEQPIVQEPSSIGQSQTPSSASVDTPPAAGNVTTPTATTPGKKGKKRSSSVAAVTAAPSAPLPTLATPPPVQKARKRGEPRAREEFIPSLEETAGPVPMSEPVSSRSLPLSAEEEARPVQISEPVSSRSLPLPVEEERAGAATPEPEHDPEMLDSGVNTPPVHVLEMGQAVQVEVTSPTQKPTSVVVGQAVPVPVRSERPVPVSLQREDDGIPDRDGSFGSAGLGGQEGGSEERMKRDRDVAAAKAQLEALGVGAPMEVVMEDLAEANVEKEQEQEQDRRHGEEEELAPATGTDTLAHESIEPEGKSLETPSLETQEPSPFPTREHVELEEAGDDEWAVSTSKNKGKKGKAKKGRQTSAPSTPQEAEPESAPRFLISEPTQESPADSSFEQPQEQTIGEENILGAVAAEPEEAGEDEWAVPVSKKKAKKGKKGKKGKRASLLNSPLLEPRTESVELLQDSRLDESMKEPSVSRESDPLIESVREQPAIEQEPEAEATTSSALPTEATGEDEWAMPSAKKDKKGKKGKWISLPGSPAPESAASEPRPEIVEPAQESVFDRQVEGPALQFAAEDVADDVQTRLQTEDAGLAPADVGGEAGEEEWAVPVRKKSKKGKKGKAVEAASDSVTALSGAFIEPESWMEPASLVGPAVESESVQAVDDIPADSQTVQTKEETSTDSPPTLETPRDEQINATQPEEAGEDEWAVSSGKKKGKKGKKGKRASLPVSPPAEPELEPTVKPVSDSLETFPGPVLPEQETATRGQASEMPDEQQVAGGQETTPTEAGEDEWALPGKTKKGKKVKRASASMQGSEALEPEVPGESSFIDPSQDSQHLDASMEASGEANEPSAPICMDLGGDQSRAEHAGEGGSLPTTTVPPIQESHGSEITPQSLDEPTLRENVEAATSPREADEWAIPKKKKKGKKSRLSLPSTPPFLEDTEKQIESSEEKFIDPSDVLKYTSAASVENEPLVADSNSMDNQPQEFHQDPVLSEVELEKGASGDVEVFIDPSDVLRFAVASQAGQERSLDQEKRAAEFDDPRPVSTAEENAPHPREQFVDQPSIAEPSTQADDSDLNPVLAPAKVSKKDKKKAKKKNKLQASLADYAPLDSSQNATDTEPLLAREPLAEPSSAPPAETEGGRPQSPQAPAATASAEDERAAVPAKKSKKEKRKSKKSRGAASPPMPPHEGDLMAGVEYFSPTEETGRAALDDPVTFGLTRDVAASAPERSSRGEALGMFEEGVVSSADSPAPRETLEESSRRGQDVEPPSSEHEGSGKREVDPSPEGPVRELPIPHETSGVSFVQDEPINEPQASKSKPNTPEERAKSPNRDIDFAATVAAGLEGAGLDANLVLNDPTFSERKSPPRSTGEADPEEVFIPARPWKKKSADATSPPAEQSKNTSTSGEKLPGQDAAFDAALSSVLADPTFNRRTPSPDSAKEAVSDEFFPFRKRSKEKKSKTPASEEELPATQEHVEDLRAPAHDSTANPFETPGDNEPFSDPGTPFEEHMPEYFPIGAAHPVATHIPPPPPLPNLGEDEQHEKPMREGLGLMGMGSSSKSWAEQMVEEEEKASRMEENEGMMGMGGKAAAVGAVVAGAAGVAALRHRGDRERGEEIEESGSKADANMAFSHGGASKSVEDFKVEPEERPFSPPTPSKLAHLFPGLERVKRRVPSPRDDFEQSVPVRRPSPIKQDNNAVRLTQPIQSNWDTLVRDSAVTMNDTPPLGVDAFHDAGRDSGYHDDSRRGSAHVPGQLLDPVPEIARHQVEGPEPTSNPQDNAAASSPTESITTTKQRSSALFQSPGSTNEALAESQRLAEAPGYSSTAPPFPQHVTEPITLPAETTQPYVSIFGDGVPGSADKPPPSLTPPRMRSPQPLDTIREHSPEESPLAKKSRPLSDVGMPDHGLKSMRRSDTEDMEASPRLPSDDHGPPKKIWSGKQPEKGPGRARGASVGSDVAVLSGRRSPSGQSDLSAASKGDFGSIFARIKTPDMLSPAGSTLSQRSATPPLRRFNRAMSGDLRTASLVAEAKALTRSNAQTAAPSATTATAGPSTYDRVHDKGKARALTMNEEHEGWGDAPDTPRSPSRPPSIRKRQSMHIMDLETRLDQLVSENRLLQDAKARAEDHQRDSTDRQIAEAVQARDEELRAKDAEIASINQTLASLREEIARLTEVNYSLTAANKNLTEDTNQRYATLQVETQQAQEQYEQTTAELDLLQQQYRHLQAGVEGVVRDEVNHRLREKEAEISRLHGELADATEQIKTLQQQTLGSKQGETFLEFRDEDYFDQACQQLCQHVQQWVLRFSKFSDTRACRLSSEVRDEKIETRLDNAILDGTDVDMLLADRVRRRDVFMSVVMTMIWEYVFTRYLFGMDREQRQKLKVLEKQLSELGPPRAVAQWRAITLTLLSRRENFQYQRSQDTEAVVQEIYNSLSALLPPPSNLVDKVLDSLRNVMRLAVDLSIEMRTQRAEYIMLPPLQPEYDKHGNLLRKVYFKASLMNERSGETSSNAELEAAHAVVKIVLFPLVVKKGDDLGDGEDEIVVCPAQVLTAKPSRDRKVVRVLSGAMEIDDRRSAGNASCASALPADEGGRSVVDLEGGF